MTILKLALAVALGWALALPSSAQVPVTFGQGAQEQKKTDPPPAKESKGKQEEKKDDKSKQKTEEKSGEGKDQAQEPAKDPDQERFESILTKLQEEKPISKADKEWAKGLINGGLKEIESGEAIKKIMAEVGAQVDQAIKEGKIKPEDKPMVLEAMKQRAEMYLAIMKVQGEAIIEAIDKAPTEGEKKKDAPKKPEGPKKEGPKPDGSKKEEPKKAPSQKK